jgi:flagellar basal-body rod modification protein FlgD
MSSIGNVGPSSSPAQAVSSRDTLGQKDFIKLMMQQFTNQDPFKPLDSTQFLSQLAQFSTVNGIESMQASLSSLVDGFKSEQMLSGASLVGREVLVPSGAGSLAAGGSLRGAVDVPAGQQQVVVAVKDKAGQLVRRFEVPAAQGVVDFTWDGKLADGSQAGAGQYAIQAIGISAGQSSSLEVLLADKVGSVTLDAATQSLVLNTSTQGTVPLARVRRIS